MRYEGQSFRNERVRLDGNEFDSCHFINVMFDYAGGPIHLRGCTFEGFDWQFGGDLARGLAVLAQLYSSNRAAAVSQVSKAMFPHPPIAPGAPRPLHPTIAKILEAEAREAAEARAEAELVEQVDYSRLHAAIRRAPFAGAA